MDETALLEAWRSGDARAGDALFQHHFESVYRFFCNKAPDDAEDLCQRTFMALVEGRDRFRGEAKVRTYLLRTARYILLNHYRDRKPGVSLDTSIITIAALSPSASSVVVHRQEHRILLEALRNIPLDLQIVMELSFWEGLSGAQIADILELPEGTVRSRQRRAREQLLGMLDGLSRRTEPLQSTMTDLDSWASGIRERLTVS